MGFKLPKFFNTTKSKKFVLYLIIGALIIVASVMLMPFWKMISEDIFFANWGYSIINVIIALSILAYLFLYLIKKVIKKGGNKVVRILTILEFVLLLIIAAGAICSQFGVVKILMPSQILGLALWLRGVVEIFRAYYFDNTSAVKFSIGELILAILFVSIGAFLLATQLVTEVTLLWILTIALCLIGSLVFVLGFVKKPIKVKNKKDKVQNKIEEKVDVKNQETIEVNTSENTQTVEPDKSKNVEI